MNDILFTAAHKGFSLIYHSTSAVFPKLLYSAAKTSVAVFYVGVHFLHFGKLSGMV